MSEKLFWWLVAILVIIKMILVGWWPFLASMDLPRDATVSLEQAMSLLEGEWLGPYTDLTLTWGPVTPIWIAVMHYIGVPLMLSQFVLYVSACVIAMLAFARLANSKGFQLCVFAVLLFNPYSYGYELVASAFREALDQSLVLAIIGLSIALFVDLIRRNRIHKVQCFLLGAFVVLFWCNGEARYWILPYLCWLVFALLVHAWWNGRFGDYDTVSGLLSIVLIPLVLWFSGTMAIAWKNAYEYDVFAVTELDTPQFNKAFDGVLSVDAGQRALELSGPPLVVEKLLSLPVAGELTAGTDEFWGRNSLSPASLRSWLRSTVFRAGYYDEGGIAVLTYYDQLGLGIETACADGTIECGGPWWRSMLPNGRGGTKTLPAAFSDVFQQVLEIPVPSSVTESYSTGSPVALLSIARLVNSPVRADDELEYFLPEFFKRTAKNKTRYLNKLVTVYQTVAPILFWIATLGLIFRIYFLRKRGEWSLLDNIYVGLAGTLLLQLVALAAARSVGETVSTHALAGFYPVFYLYILTGLLSITRDIREIIPVRFAS